MLFDGWDEEKNVNILYENFVSNVKNTAKFVGMIDIKNIRMKILKPWFDLECRKSYKLCNEALKTCKKLKFSDDSVVNYKNRQKIF